MVLTSQNLPLLDAARRGEPAAIQQLLRLCKADARRYAQRHCLANQVDDAVQEALLTDVAMTDAGVEPPDDVVVMVGDAGAATPSVGTGGDGQPGEVSADGGVAAPGEPPNSGSPGGSPAAPGGQSTAIDGCSVTHAGGYGSTWTALFGALAQFCLAARTRRAKSAPRQGATTATRSTTRSAQ